MLYSEGDHEKIFTEGADIKPPKHHYAFLEAFVFLGSYEADLSLSISVFRFHRFKGVIL